MKQKSSIGDSFPLFSKSLLHLVPGLTLPLRGSSPRPASESSRPLPTLPLLEGEPFHFAGPIPLLLDPFCSLWVVSDCPLCCRQNGEADADMTIMPQSRTPRTPPSSQSGWRGDDGCADRSVRTADSWNSNRRACPDSYGWTVPVSREGVACWHAWGRI